MQLGICCLLAAASWGVLSFADAQSWDQFRGPNGSGIGVGPPPPAEFGLSTNLIWKAALPPGKSSPVVSGGRIFITGNEGDSLLTFCIDTHTGRIIWRQAVSRLRRQHRHPLNDPASPTPAVDQSGVYAFFPEFGIVSYSMAGKERWRLETPLLQSMHGHASSPVLAAGSVFLVCDQRKHSFVLAVDAKTGKTRWKVDRPDSMGGIYSTPAINRPTGGPAQLIVIGDSELAAYSLARGEKLWWVRGLPPQAKTSPAVSEDTVYVAIPSLFGEGGTPTYSALLQEMDKNKDGLLQRDETPIGGFREGFHGVDTNSDGAIDEREWDLVYRIAQPKGAVMALRPDGRGDLSDRAVLWKNDKGLPAIPTPLVYDSILYMIRNGGVLTSVDANTGELRKQGRIPGALGPYYASPIGAGGRIYTVNQECTAAVLKAGAQWELLAVHNLDGECFATPAISEGRLFVRTTTGLYAFAENRGAGAVAK